MKQAGLMIGDQARRARERELMCLVVTRALTGRERREGERRRREIEAAAGPRDLLRYA